MTTINVPFLTKSVLASEALNFLNENKLHEIPIDIEFVAESKYETHIVPFPGLIREYGIDGYSASDFSAIYVDDFTFNQRPTRLRFTVAHEIGHRVLHEKYLKTIEFSSVDEWIEVLNNLDYSDHEKMEYQANSFAGLILIPQSHLENHFQEQLETIMPLIEEAQSNKLTKADYIDIVVDSIADTLSKKFEVSNDAMTIQIKKTSLDNLIP